MWNSLYHLNCLKYKKTYHCSSVVNDWLLYSSVSKPFITLLFHFCILINNYILGVEFLLNMFLTFSVWNIFIKLFIIIIFSYCDIVYYYICDVSTKTIHLFFFSIKVLLLTIKYYNSTIHIIFINIFHLYYVFLLCNNTNIIICNAIVNCNIISII